MKGQLYFKNMQISGSKEGIEKEPNMTLLPYRRDVLFPWLEEMAIELGDEGEEGVEGVEIVPYYEIDGAGPHQYKRLFTTSDEEFNRMGWIFRF